MSTERVAVVVAGAGARGSYEAGVLAVLVPRLREAVAGPLTFVGTSAGAINGPRRGDLLSYLFFDHDFIAASIELGQRDAKALLGPGEVPWQTGRLRSIAAMT
jgi:hypothetical protein